MASTTDCSHTHAAGRLHRFGPSFRAQPSTEHWPEGTDATQFRLLRPLLRPQQTDSSCSAAAMALVISALRQERSLPPVSEDDVVATDQSGRWARAVAAGGVGVGLDALRLFAMQAQARLAGPHFGPGVVDIAHVPGADEPALRQQEAKQAFEYVLGRSQALPNRSFVVVNAPQSRLFAGGDPVGHFVVVGGYNEESGRVLIFDVDNIEGLQPFWLPLADLWSAMQARDDATGETRGYLWLRAGE